MNKSYLEKLKAIMADPSQLNLGMLKGFIDETLLYFQNLQEVIRSGDETQKAEALKEASQMKAALEEQIKGLSHATGLSPEQMMAFAANHANLDDSEWKVVEDARQRLLGTKKSKPHTASKPKLKIVG